MGTSIMGAVVSLDGFIADDADGVGPLIREAFLFDNPSRVVRGNRVTHLVFDVVKG